MALDYSLETSLAPQQQTASPVYGDQVINPEISPAKDVLSKSISKDLSMAGQNYNAAQSAAGRYNPGLESAFAEKGIRIGKNIVAQNEFNKAIENQKKAVADYSKAAGFTDQTSSAIAQSQLNDRLNKLRVELIKRGLEWDRKLAEQQASEEERRQAAQMWGGLAGTVAGGVIGGLAGGPAGAMMGTSTGGQVGSQLAGGVA